jgi:hypothetical protein
MFPPEMWLVCSKNTIWKGQRLKENILVTICDVNIKIFLCITEK